MEESTSLGMTCDCLHSDYSPEQGRFDMTNRLLLLLMTHQQLLFTITISMAIEALHVQLLNVD